MKIERAISGYRTFINRWLLPKTHPLRYLFLEITRVCNLHCTYCGSDCTEKPQNEEMTAEQWIKVLRTIASDFRAEKIMIAVTGGEPLMKEGIFDILRTLNELKFPFGMVTNGTHLDESKARELVATGIGSISVSMDAPQEANDRNRGKGTSEQTIRGIQNLQKAGYRGILEVISTLTKNTYAQLEETQKLLREIKVPFWRVAAAFPIGRALRFEKNMLGYDEIRDLLEFVKTKRERKEFPLPEFCDEGFLSCRYERKVRPYAYHCLAGITIGGIKADGAIGACPELPIQLDQGSVLKDRFSTIWNERYQSHRDRSWMKKGICTECTDFGKCQGNSLHLWDFAKDKTRRCYLHEICPEQSPG